MRSVGAMVLVVTAVLAWNTGLSEPEVPDDKTIEQLAEDHDSVSVSTDVDGIYITFVKGTEVHRCAVQENSGPPGTFSEGYMIYCDPLHEWRPQSP